jgi:hypothetical protein
MTIPTRCLVFPLAALLISCPLLAAEPREAPAGAPGIVSHVTVLSDKVEDVSSLEAWKQAFITPGMSDEQKAEAIWRTVVMFRHQEVPPNEFLDGEGHPHDPIKDFNVYGYGQCCCASANVEALARYAGLETRGWGITGHSVPEIKIGGNWCMFDASLINYFKKPDGSVAGVEEVGKNITDWYAAHPEFKGNSDKLLKYMRHDGWKNGPELVAGGTGYDDNGWLPAATHGWYSSMSEFGNPAKNFVYEYGSAVGYQVNIQLRPGEKLVRNWSNKGLHVNMLEGKSLGVLTESPADPHGQMRYAPRFGDLTLGRVGNGTLEYDLPLAGGRFRDGMLQVDNLADADKPSGPTIFVKDAAEPATLVFRMPSSYVYLGGELDFTPIVGPGGSIGVSLSDNNGLDWKEIAKVDDAAAGGRGQKVDLKPFVYRRYDYRLKFVLKGKGTGLNAVKVTHDIQHSQRPLPVLDKGDNHITFSEGPQEGTVTVEGSLNPNEPAAKGKNLSYADFHPRESGVVEPFLHVNGATGEFIYPIEAPGDITRLRIGAHYRCRDARDGWTIEASFDGGKTYVPVGTLDGPTGGTSKYLILDKVPAGSRSVLVRFAGRQRNTTVMLDLRIDADYAEPHGGFAPVRVTYAWQENGQDKQDVHVAGAAEESYTIHCADKPVMKSITLERGS